ncbi:alpha/beta hydrolase family protein [Aureliella helgolandensis]|uniref:Alpha/beta hydrolase family protein n=1 Tax=Aureliella helgolandensis TaxID=2527968 RepID=A0A518GBZ0_9BACT|nr:CocE/NonD family hydrolase [Aureliella helgolandensis]QDV26094.1 Alpha/beta hydrolase family protein [Aureliella helgolandensis]
MDAYLEQRVEALEENCLAGIDTDEQWNAARPGLELQLREMLGLAPWPERTELHPTIVQTQRHEGFTVENLHFQSLPGLYVAANLYLPADTEAGPFPTILYVCGHASVQEDGVRMGNKTAYHHHGIWFAKHGYACMIIDTVQLGEFDGKHHGTYRHGRWWWNSRGYTPAGVEAWNSMRALDYLETRQEVDASRFGITGRSGGGVYSWWTTAIDPRIKVAVPVAGITDVRNHVVDGCIEGHCDCMYMVNNYGWDFATVAALVAPRPLLISNSDQDSIFPLDGVMRVHEKTAKIYKLLQAEESLGIHITEGPHKDTQMLRVGAFAWFEKHFKKSVAEFDSRAPKALEPAELRVFTDGLPSNERVTTVDEWFVPQVVDQAITDGGTTSEAREPGWQDRLSKVPGAIRDVEGFSITSAEQTEMKSIAGVELHKLVLDTASALKSYAILALPAKSPTTEARLCVGSTRDSSASGDSQSAHRVEFVLEGEVVTFDASSGQFEDAERVASLVSEGQTNVLFLMLQGTGDSAWHENERETTHLKRRIFLVGQSLDAIRASEIRGVLRLLEAGELANLKPATVRLEASGPATCLAMLAVLDFPEVGLVLHAVPADLAEQPILLGLSKVTNIPQLLRLASASGRTISLRESSTEVAE